MVLVHVNVPINRVVLYNIYSCVPMKYPNLSVKVRLELHTLHQKSRKVCIKARSTLASLSLKGQVTKQTNVNWAIVLKALSFISPRYVKD